MSNIIIKYSDFSEENRPKLRLHLYYKERGAQVDCILDSGADCTVITAAFSKILFDIDFTTLTPSLLDRIATLSGGRVQTAHCLCNRKIPCLKFPLMVSIAGYPEKFPIPVVWLLQDTDADPVIGREGFFEMFNVLFKEKDRIVELQPNIDVINERRKNFSLDRLYELIAQVR